MNHLVSIIIPVYNVEKYIEKCLISVINQNYNNIEIIVVNDGSTDKSEYYINRILKHCDNCIIINQENKGLSEARNKGISLAKGKYLFLLDSDDYIKSDVIAKMVEKIEKDNSDILIGKYNLIRTNGERKSNIEKLDETVIMNNIDALKALFSSGLFHFHAWGKLYKRELFYNVRYPQGRYYEDIGTTYKLLYNAKKISFLNFSTCEYLMREDSICNSNFNKKHLDFIENINEMEIYLKSKNIFDIMKSDFRYMKLSNYMQLGFNKIACSNMTFDDKCKLINQVKIKINEELIDENIVLNGKQLIDRKLINLNVKIYIIKQILENKLKKIYLNIKKNKV